MACLIERTTEVEVGRATLWVLLHMPENEATIRELIQELPEVLELSPADRTESLTRPGEELWEQQVRNLVSHRTTTGNIICEGYAIYLPSSKRLKLTAAGMAYLVQLGYVEVDA